MVEAQPVTETVILRFRKDVKSENITSDSTVRQAFVELTDTTKAFSGFIRQYWGSQVEHPANFVWCIDWESSEHYISFLKSDEHTSFLKSEAFNQLFDLDALAPVDVCTNWTTQYEDAAKAFNSGVTEFAFFMMPEGISEADKTKVVEDSPPTMEAVQTIGKATGAALGWGQTRSLPGRVLLVGSFGYASVAVHMAWRETPEVAKLTAPKKEDIPMEPAAFPGIEPHTGYFHVHFQSHH